MTFKKRPAKLTPEYVKAHYQKMIENIIRKFHVQDPVEDIFHDIILAMMVPSRTLGTSYLDRYDPSRAYASTYLTVMATNFMKGVYRKDNDRRRINPVPESQLPGLNSVCQNRAEDKINRKLVANLADEHNVEAEVVSKVEQRQLLQYLRNEVNTNFSSRSGKGSPRSTWRVCAMILLKQMSIPEVAEELGVTPVEVRRRVKLLVNDPVLRQTAKDHGWSLQETG